MLARALALFLSLLLAAPAFAWNATGHRAIAAIAYDNLTPAARAKADELIRRHPDYQRYFLDNAPTDPAARARAAFIASAYWPDQIRGDDRFYDETRRDAQPTPMLPSFPNMGRHTIWHYYDIPFSQDGTRTREQRPPHALSEVSRLINILSQPVDSRNNPAYALPWVLHIVGDLHNPLHTVSRFARDLPGGDQGGNLVFTGPDGRNLHSLWDSAGGLDSSLESVNRYASDVVREYRAKYPSQNLETNPKKWVEEGAALAKSQVYTFGLANGTRAEPIHLPAGYEQHAAQVARLQIAAAGLRLAATLNRQLGR
jgi:hypothetical protein